MNKKVAPFLMLTIVLYGVSLCQAGQPVVSSDDKVYPGADERTPSYSQYFSWINNTNEGSTKEQTMVNLDFFQWLRDEYGMVLDIYVISAGAIDKAGRYGKMDSDAFRRQFPNGFGPIYEKAKTMGTRLGTWGGPDGFGDTANPGKPSLRSSDFIQLQPAAVSRPSASIVFGGQIELSIHNDCDKELLRHIISQLKGSSC